MAITDVLEVFVMGITGVNEVLYNGHPHGHRGFCKRT